MKNFLSFLSLIIFFSSLSWGEPSLFRVPIGVQIQNLDQSEAEDFVTVRVLMNLGAGLVKINKDLTPLPALAKNWQISKDQKTFTFNLKKNLWSNGKPIVAQD